MMRILLSLTATIHYHMHAQELDAFDWLSVEEHVEFDSYRSLSYAYTIRLDCVYVIV